MEQIFILIAMGLPTILGGLWLNLFVPPCVPGRAALVWGAGTLIGLLFIPILMRLIDALGFPIGFPLAATLLTFLTAIVATINIRLRGFSGCNGATERNLAHLSFGNKTLAALLLLLIAVRILTVGLELIWQPFLPWDATMHWATKARVWFEFDSMMPFVDNKTWLRTPWGHAFTDPHPYYPATIPLLQVWMTSAAGGWNESLMNIPWLLCMVSLGAAFYGQLRFSGAGITLSIIGVYLLLSMPLLNTHVALAGYADLFLGACYCAAIMSLHSWAISRQPWQAALALFFAACCPLVKNEGLFWMLTLGPAVAVIMAPRVRAVLLFSATCIVILGMLSPTLGDFEFAGRSLDQLKLGYRERALLPIFTSLWMQGNWHLASYLIVMVFAVSCFSWRTSMAPAASIVISLACALALFAFLFTYTKFASGAVRFTSIGRISMHLLPAFLYMTMILCAAYFQRNRLNT